MDESLPGTPIAYLITFRAYGTWLHGDARGSVDRHDNVYGAPRIPPNSAWQDHNRQTLKQEPVTLGAERRNAVRDAVCETCAFRSWTLFAVNVRTNHVLAVVSARVQAERVLNALKANATRVMRERGYWASKRSPWVEGGSTRYLWTEQGLECAISYVVNGQGVRLDP
jgi:REP element-mobilizing transposase RayT